MANFSLFGPIYDPHEPPSEEEDDLLIDKKTRKFIKEYKEDDKEKDTDLGKK